MSPKMRLLWSQILLFGLVSAAAASERLFDGNELLEIDLHGPVWATVRDDRKRRERPFTIVAAGHEYPVAVRVRGKSRLRECRFPPLRLHFRPADVAGGLFDDLDKVKLVTHCRDRAHYEQNLLEEYVAYRIFNLLTERSRRVRLMRISYHDTDRAGKPPLVRYAFAIEPIERTARRNGLELAATEFVVKSKLDKAQSALVYAFHYLIGNVDWSLVTAKGEDMCCHNGSLLLEDGKYLLVPYDFDLSGLVDARYARPAPEMPIRTVRQRLYRGYCMDGLPLDDAIRRIAQQEAAIRSIVRDLPGTSPEETRDRLEYLHEYFEAAAAGNLAQDWAAECVG